MTPKEIEKAVGLLLAARGDFRRLDGFPADCAPRSIEDGYAVQEAFAAAWGLPVAGYKIACTSEEAQRMLKSPAPFPGRVFAPYLLNSPAEVAHGAFHDPGVEGEFAFTLAGDLPARKTAYARAEVEAAIAAVHPAIEIVDPRWRDWIGAGVAAIVADNAANGALVLGPGTADWRRFDLPRHGVRLVIDGREIARGTGAAVLGDPVTALVWLANDLSRRGFGLKAGQAVTTGTCTSLHKVKPGAVASVEFGALGSATVAFQR
jgi:2-keto-4-pentenoate hydratase